MNARSFAVRWGLRVLVALVCVGPSVGGGALSEPVDPVPSVEPVPSTEELEADRPVREALKKHEWFDYERDDYHRYAPEEIEVPEQGWSCRPPEAGVPAGGGAGIALFLQLLVYVLIAAVVALIGFLLYRIIEERRNQPALSDEIAAATIAHSELPADLARQAGVRRPLNLKRLRELVESALAAGDARAACVYMYLFALLRLGAAGLLELKGDQTARDYTAQLEQRLASAPGPSTGSVRAKPDPQVIAVFRGAARFFEYALYRGRLPPDADAQAAGDLWRELQAVVG